MYINNESEISMCTFRMIPFSPEIAEFWYILDPNGFATDQISRVKNIMLRNGTFVVSQGDHSAILENLKRIAIQAVHLKLPSAKRVGIWTAINISSTRNWTIIADNIYQLTGMDMFQLTRTRKARKNRQRPPKRARRRNPWQIPHPLSILLSSHVLWHLYNPLGPATSFDNKHRGKGEGELFLGHKPITHPIHTLTRRI